MQHMRHSPAAGDDGFFIPNLCAPQTVLLAVLLAELVVLLHVLALGPLVAFDWRTLAIGSLFVQWNSLLCIALICALRRFLQSQSPALATAVCLGTVVGVTLLSTLAVYLLYPVPWPATGSLADWLLRNALLALILAAIVLRYSYLQQRVASQQRSELQLRLDALRSRIRPHFLFNTLNSIASLIAVQPERAEQAIEDVAQLFRAALQADDRDSSVGEECELCALYLDIETLRLGDRLQVEWDVDDSLRGLNLPALLLQPLVENAVYHGVAQLPDGGTVTIRGWRDPRSFSLEVSNPLAKSNPTAVGSGQHMALDNIRQRLEAQYGSAASLALRGEDGVFRARITLPLAGVGT